MKKGIKLTLERTYGANAGSKLTIRGNDGYRAILNGVSALNNAFNKKKWSKVKRNTMPALVHHLLLLSGSAPHTKRQIMAHNPFDSATAMVDLTGSPGRRFNLTAIVEYV